MDVIESLPIFPLSDVVLLPDVSIPLYIFEPRYRQMTRDALAGSHRIGMVTVRPDRVSEMAGDPAIFEIGCVGRIAQSQERPDGTFQILLLGEKRFRILEEEPREGERLYRSARVELLTDVTPNGPEELAQLEGRRRELLALIEDLVRRIAHDGAPAEAITAFERLDPTRLINSLTQSIALTPIERQQLLEAPSILHRFEIMGDLLRFRLAEVGAGAQGNARLPN
jgi:hypothetical protein